MEWEPELKPGSPLGGYSSEWAEQETLRLLKIRSALFKVIS